MLYLGQAPGGTIQVLCGTPENGMVKLTSRLGMGFTDPWNPSLPVGGGPGPRPGTYEPKFGFGILWNQYPDCLGYATSPDETYYDQTWQWFAGGIMISTPGQQAYLLYGPGRYQRYQLP
jgi:hypothetical protein